MPPKTNSVFIAAIAALAIERPDLVEVCDNTPKLYWVAYCCANHGGYPAYWTGVKSDDAQQCEMRHVTTNGGAHRFWMPCRDMRQTDLPPILSQKEILALRVMSNGEVR